MRVLIYSDLQATDGHERCFTNPSKSLQLWRVERFYDELRRIYEEKKCDALWDLGDTTDDRSAIPVSVIDLLCDKLATFTGEWNLKLVGNHEQFLRDTRIHAGKMFRQFFRVVDTCAAFKFGKVNILCVSYHDDNGQILDWIRHRVKTADRSILIGHFQVEGCSMNSGKANSGIPLENLKFLDVGLLGHIHRPQTMGNVHYVGSPFQQHWGEAGESKRVAILDLEFTTSSPNNHSASIEWVPMTGFPIYRQVTLAEFVDQAREDSEDRFKVVLRNLEETERFYAHPLCNHADEAIYAYEENNPVSSLVEQTVPRTRKDVMALFLKKRPPVDFGFSIDDKTMLDFGDSLLTP